MASLQTSCPNCGSSFKISQQQLNAAGGHVRCGSCRHVFDAQSRAVKTDSHKPVATHGLSADSRQTGRHTLEGDIGEFSQSFLDLNKTGQGTSPFLDMSDLDKSLAEKEEAWTQALLDDDDSGTAKRPDIPDYLSLGENSLQNKVNTTLGDETALDSGVEAIDLDVPVEDSKSRNINSLDQFIESSDAEKASSNADNSFSSYDDFDFLEESEANREVDEYSDTFEAKLDALFGDEDKPITAKEDDPFEGLDDGALAQTSHKAALIQQIQTDPLELTLPSKRWKKLKTAGWICLALVLLCLPVLQYIHFNFDELAQQANLRPIFGQVCEKVGCQLPPQKDISLIKTGNLVVRTHPEEAGALAIDAVLTNRANYSQPFPVLELLFTDAQGSVIAARAFQPSEYLKGELLGATLMQQRQPVHIALAIQDPGARAVGYALQLKPAP